MSPKLRFAILDDYQGIARPHFAHLEDRVDIVCFPKTLDPHIPAEQEALVKRLKTFDVILAMRERTPFAASTIAALPNLKLLLTTGTRNLALDLDAFTQQGIAVAGTEGRPPGVNATVQHTWALILGLARHLARDDAAIKAGGWQGTLGMGLSGKTLGLLGLGKLGSQVGKIAVQAFGMRVVAWSTNLTQEKADEQARAQDLAPGSFLVAPSKAEFFTQSDIVSIHSVLSDRSRGIVGAEDLARMKPHSLIINTSRGPLIDEPALLEALQTGHIRGAALDVFDREPLPLNSPWRTTPWGQGGRSEVLLSPHVSFYPFALLQHILDFDTTRLGILLSSVLPKTSLLLDG